MKPCSSRSPRSAGHSPDSLASPPRTAQSPAPIRPGRGWWPFAIWRSWLERDPWATRDTWGGRRTGLLSGPAFFHTDVYNCKVLLLAPEGVESPHVQHGEQLGFGFGKGQAVTESLESGNHKSLLGVPHVQMHHGPSVAQNRRRHSAADHAPAEGSGIQRTVTYSGSHGKRYRSGAMREWSSFSRWLMLATGWLQPQYGVTFPPYVLDEHISNSTQAINTPRMQGRFHGRRTVSTPPLLLLVVKPLLRACGSTLSLL